MTGDFSSRTLVRGADSGGRIALVEMSVPAHWEGPPLHHHAFDEAFHVLDGELTFQFGDELRTGRRGQTAFAPGGSIHTLANLSATPARYLLVITPAGFERRFDADPSGPVPETIVVGPPIAPGPATPLPGLDGRINVLVRGAESDGRMSLKDNRVGADAGGPPLHHHEFDEAFYILEGEVTFQVGEEIVVRRAGDLAFARGGLPHTFANLSGAEARQLLVCTPAGFERYFQRMAAKASGVDPPPEALEPWPEVTRVGPPLTQR
jgi:quercetin dioxygenase-like cupin family protein